MSELDLHEEAILIRTEAGQHAVFDDADLDAPRRRLLRLVNGYTPLSGLAARLDPRADWGAAARSLVEHRLVRVHQPDGSTEEELPG
jgi:hypothetical protein